MDALNDKVVSHVLVPIEHITRGLANQHDVYEFLRCVAMLGEERVLPHVHINKDVVDASSQNYRVNQEDAAMAIRRQE